MSNRCDRCGNAPNPDGSCACNSGPIATAYEREPVCPHCGHEHRDAWEWDFGTGMEGEATFECDHCEKEFVCSREVEVTYSTRKVENKEPFEGDMGEPLFGAHLKRTTKVLCNAFAPKAEIKTRLAPIENSRPGLTPVQ